MKKSLELIDSVDYQSRLDALVDSKAGSFEPGALMNFHKSVWELLTSYYPDFDFSPIISSISALESLFADLKQSVPDNESWHDVYHFLNEGTYNLAVTFGQCLQRGDDNPMRLSVYMNKSIEMCDMVFAELCDANNRRLFLENGGKRSLPMELIRKTAGVNWSSVPQFEKVRGGIEEVDALKLMEPILTNEMIEYFMTGSLRTMDIANGCNVQCQTCLVDAPRPSTFFTKESLEALFSDMRFLQILHPTAFRVGSVGDISDHPDAAYIVEMILKKTEELNITAIENHKRPHVLKVYTNFRKGRAGVLDELLKLAVNNGARMRLVISLPLNTSSRVREDFVNFVKERPEFFRLPKPDSEGGYNFYEASAMPYFVNIGIHDVAFREKRFVTGRIIEDRDKSLDLPADQSTSFHHQGSMKTLLNPDALWAHMYATVYESHTLRLYAPINLENILKLCELPWNTNFPFDPEGVNPPPNWPGGGRVSQGIIGFIRRIASRVFLEEQKK